MRHIGLAGGLFAATLGLTGIAGAGAAQTPQGSVFELDLPDGHGTAFYIGTQFGTAMFVTAAHVVDGAENADIVLHGPDGSVLAKNTVVLFDAVHDLAVVASDSIDPKVNLPAALPLDCGTAPMPGAAIVAWGYPELFGEIRSSGTVAGAEPISTNGWASVILADLTVAHGSSGGPVLGADGRVVGIVVGWFSPTGFSAFVPVRGICDWVANTGVDAESP